MMLKGKGRIIQISRNKIGIYIPAKIHNDPAFPFIPKQDVKVMIDKGKLIIERLNKSTNVVKRRCEVCGKEELRGYYNKYYDAFICDSCAEEQETKPYGRYCEFCGCDTFLEKHKDKCPEA